VLTASLETHDDHYFVLVYEDHEYWLRCRCGYSESPDDKALLRFIGMSKTV
jgi:CDGSH-type Zn-finger protein